jgi:hypothetical protein
MRTLYLGTGPERVEGMITDLLKNDMNIVKNVVELAVQFDDIEDAPTTGWALRAEVRMLGDYTVLPVVFYNATVRGTYALWGRWVNGPETVMLRVGRFRVI